MTVTYHLGDTRDVTATIPDGSVSLIATSPPFLALRSYLPADHPLKHAEIGSEPDPATFLDTLLALTAEWGRVLAPWGSIAVELGDTYAGSGGAGGDYGEGGLRSEQPTFQGSAARSDSRRGYGGAADRKDNVRREGLRSTGKSEANGWPLAKSLALIPQLYAIALAYGINPLTGQPSPAGRWRVRNVIVWHRPNPAVGALGDKVRPSTSYIVVATRSDKRWFDLTAVRGEGSPNTHARTARGVEVRETTGKRAASDGNFDTLATEHRSAPGTPPLDCWFDAWDGSHDTWTITTQPSSLSHYAMWPAKLAERLILSMCPAEVCTACATPRRRMEGKTPEYAAFRASKTGVDLTDARVAYHLPSKGGAGSLDHRDDSAARGPKYETLGWTDCGCGAGWTPGVVLDPFAGTFTTGCVAEFHGRDAIGIDIDSRNRDLWPMRKAEVFRSLNPTHVKVLDGQMDLFGGVA